MASMGFNDPDSSILQPTVRTGNGMANEFLSRLGDYITRFEQGLADGEELALKIVSFSEAVTIIVEDIGYWKPQPHQLLRCKHQQRACAVDTACISAELPAGGGKGG